MAMLSLQLFQLLLSALLALVLRANAINTPVAFTSHEITDVADFTNRVEGLGDLCNLDFRVRHASLIRLRS